MRDNNGTAAMPYPRLLINKIVEKWKKIFG
jgi:hypothetical protein